jgi:hypothetical protein
VLLNIVCLSGTLDIWRGAVKLGILVGKRSGQLLTTAGSRDFSLCYRREACPLSCPVSLYPKVKRSGREANKADIMKMLGYPHVLTLFFIALFLIKHTDDKLRLAVNSAQFASVPCGDGRNYQLVEEAGNDHFVLLHFTEPRSQGWHCWFVILRPRVQMSAGSFWQALRVFLNSFSTNRPRPVHYTYSSFPVQCYTVWDGVVKYRIADKSLARPRRKQVTATEDFGFPISYL